MGKKKRLSRDQKRKAKKTDRARRSNVMPELAYTGEKYKTDELTPVFHTTETAIHEADVMTGRTLTDPVVARALTRLVLQLRQGPLPPFDLGEGLRWVHGQEEDLIVNNIRLRWEDLFSTDGHPGTGNLEGVLRTLLGSIGTWGSRKVSTRGYLRFVEGFLRKTGVEVQRLPADMLDEDEDEEIDPADELLECGRAWMEGDREAARDFPVLVDEMIRDGDARTVSEVCRQLIGEATGTPTLAALFMPYALKADDAVRLLEDRRGEG